MNGEDKLEQAINRRAQAEALRNNEMLQEVFEQLHNEAITAWIGSSSRDTERREILWHRINVIGQLKDDFFDRIIAAGNMAEMELKNKHD